MPEISPQITYYPEGILEIRRVIGDGIANEAPVVSADKERVGGLPGYEVTEEGLSTVVSVDISRVTSNPVKLDFKNPSADAIIENLKRFIGFVGYEDPLPVDNVFSIESWDNRGSTGVIHPQFQKWLNAGGLNEETARECLNAMAYPFGEETRKKASEQFRYMTDGSSAQCDSYMFRAVSKLEPFGVYEDASDRRGKVAWNWIDLSTIGDCACWGVDGEKRGLIYIRDESTRLYEMGPHNVDSSVQSLSLVLGVAALAYRAAMYKGTEGILDNAEWK